MTDTAVYEIKVKLNDEQMREIRAIREEAIDRAVRAEAKLAAVFALAEKLISKEEDGSWSECEGSDDRIPPRQVTRIIDLGVEHQLVEVRADQYVQLTNGKSCSRASRAEYVSVRISSSSLHRPVSMLR